MSETRMTLNRADIQELQKVLDEFPDVDSFELITIDGGGIGYNVDIEFPEKRNNRITTVRVEVCGVENW